MSKKILALIGEDFEDLELSYPVLRLREAGCQVDLVGEEAGHTYHGKYGVPFASDYSFDQVEAADYDGLLVPGGWAPDKLRRFSRQAHRRNLPRGLGPDLSGYPAGQNGHQHARHQR